MESDPRKWIAALRNSHERLDGLVRRLTPGQLREQSYCTEWTNAQVLSHLGSGAEIALLMLPGALGTAEPAGPDDFPPVWNVWNAKSPDDQAADALDADERLLRTLERLSDDDLARMRLSFYGMELDSAGLIGLRLGEHAMHTWDIAVYLDPAATVAPDAVPLLIDNVPQLLAPLAAKPLGEPYSVRIRITGPDRDYLLTSADTVHMTDWTGDEPAAGAAIREVSMPAETLLRLAYGRLDPEHIPAQVQADTADLARLRIIFPGF